MAFSKEAGYHPDMDNHDEHGPNPTQDEIRKLDTNPEKPRSHRSDKLKRLGLATLGALGISMAGMRDASASSIDEAARRSMKNGVNQPFTNDGGTYGGPETTPTPIAVVDSGEDPKGSENEIPSIREVNYGVGINEQIKPFVDQQIALLKEKGISPKQRIKMGEKYLPLDFQSDEYWSPNYSMFKLKREMHGYSAIYLGMVKFSYYPTNKSANKGYVATFGFLKDGLLSVHGVAMSDVATEPGKPVQSEFGAAVILDDINQFNQENFVHFPDKSQPGLSDGHDFVVAFSKAPRFSQFFIGLPSDFKAMNDRVEREENKFWESLNESLKKGNKTVSSKTYKYGQLGYAGIRQYKTKFAASSDIWNASAPPEV